MKVIIKEKKKVFPATAAEIILGLKEYADEIDTVELQEMQDIIQSEILSRVRERKSYSELLNEAVASALSMKGSSGYEALRKIICDLQGDGPIAALMHTLDSQNHQMIMLLLREFRISGTRQPFNALHQHAKNAICGEMTDVDLKAF